MSAAIAEQPAPLTGAASGRAVWPLVFEAPGLALPDWLIADMRARHELGVKRYGTPLTVWNGRDPVVDAYQEALDLIVYTQQARCRLGAYTLNQRGGGTGDLGLRLALDTAFHSALTAAMRLGEAMRLGGVPAQPPIGATR